MKVYAVSGIREIDGGSDITKYDTLRLYSTRKKAERVMNFMDKFADTNKWDYDYYMIDEMIVN